MKTKSSIARIAKPNMLMGRYRAVCAARLLPLLLLMLPAVGQAQDYTYTINNGAITITGYYGYDSAVTIPSMIDGLPVTSIGTWAFEDCTSLTSITIPNSITSIGDGAFIMCFRLTNVTIGNSITSIGDEAFAGCYSLANVPIGNGVTSIGRFAFYHCDGLTSVTIPDSVTSIGVEAFEWCIGLTNVTIGNHVTSLGGYAFYKCTRLTEACFRGNAPAIDSFAFYGDTNVTVFYLPGTTSWGSTFSGRPTAPWYLPNPLILNNPSFGVQTNGFGFIISWATNISVVVEACTNFTNPVWQPVQTNTLTDGWCYFSNPDWTNYPVRFYHLRSP
jgi:hypothetical protein